MKCVMCSRALRQATVMIGANAVGPVCARRAGLLDLARKGKGGIRLGVYRPTSRALGSDNLELFPEAVEP